MINVPSRVRVSCLAASLLCLLLAPNAFAKGYRGMAHASGGGHAPKMHAAPHPAYHAPKMPHNAPNMAPRAPKVPHATAPKPVKPQNVVRTNPRSAAGQGYSAQNHYYGRNRSYGRGRMPYRGYGYGGRRYGSNRYTGAIVSRLRSAHAALARADRDYQGHRVRAMHAVRSAIRQLAHSSSRRYGMFGVNSGVFQAVANRNNLAGRGGRQRGNLSQMQSDALMRRAQQTLQLVGSHMANQGGTSRMARAYGYVNQAAQHVNIALSIR